MIITVWRKCSKSSMPTYSYGEVSVLPRRMPPCNGLGTGMPPTSGSYSRTRPARNSHLLLEDRSARQRISAPALRFDCFARGLQRECERLLWDSSDKRSDHPAKPRGNVPCKRSYLALDVNAAIALFHAPPRLHPPHEPAIVARSFFAFIARPGVFHFRNAYRRAAAVRFSRSVMEVLHFMLTVQHYGDHLVPPKPQKNPEVIAFSRLDLGSFNVRRVVHRVPVIIFKHAQHVFEFRSRNEHHAGPVMNHPAGAGHRLIVVEHFQLLHLYFASFQRRIGLRALFLGENVNPQQVRTAFQLTFISRFHLFYVPFKRFLRLRFQLWKRRSGGLRAGP